MIFDANFAVGRFAGGAGGDLFTDARAVSSWLERRGVGAALIYHALARECDTAAGNAAALDFFREARNLAPCFVLRPEDGLRRDALAPVTAAGVKAVRLFPKTGRFQVNPLTLEKLAEKISSHKLVLFIDFESSGWGDNCVDWRGLHELCAAFPMMRTVLLNCPQSGVTDCMPLLERHKNFYMDAGMVFSNRILKLLVSEGFAGRLVMGSNAPFNDPGGIVSLLNCSDIDEKSAAAIGGETLAGLLGVSAPVIDRIIQSKNHHPAIDIHVHHGGWSRSLSGEDGSIDALVENMRRCGVQAAAVTSVLSCMGGVRKGNRAVADGCEKYPGVIYGYITVDPKYPAEMAAELAAYGGNPGFAGLKLHCGCHEVSLDAPEYAPALEFADSKSWPVLVHWGTDCAAWDAVCGKYPNAKFMCAHISGGQHLKLAALCRKHENLIMDLSGSLAAAGFAEKVVEAAGAGHVVWGSDYPLFDQGYCAGRVRRSSLAPEQKNAVLFANAARILGISPKN
jgi:predicted TIM-barrel fold metal-dependent hydrolase